MQKTYTIRSRIITDSRKSNSILQSGKYLVYIIAKALWRIFCLFKEVTTGCVITVFSNLISDFTYGLPLEQLPSEKVLCMQRGYAS